MKRLIFTTAIIAVIMALPAYAADRPTNTALAKSIAPSLKQYSPMSVLEQDGDLYVQLPRPEITDFIYKNFIQAGFCLGKMFNEEADWSGVKSVTVMNETKTQGWRFNGGEKECEAINNTKVGETAPLISERKVAFESQAADPASQYKGQWRTQTGVSKIDDSTNVYIELNADYPFTNDFGQSVTPTLFIRCAENKTNIGVDWKTFLDIDNIPVLYRMGNETAKTTEWTIASNNLAVFAPSPISFIRDLMKHDKLLVQVIPHAANKATAEFFVNGLDNAIKPLQDACGWR